MYWTDVNERSPKIECSWMNGEQRQPLVSDRLLRPTGLAIDYHKNDRVFWSDSKENVIESVNSDGSDRAIVIRSGENYHFSVHPRKAHGEDLSISIPLSHSILSVANSPAEFLQ